VFGDDDTCRPQSTHANRIAIVTSFLAHVILGALGLWLSAVPRAFVSAKSPPIARRYDLVWIASPGPGGGGGGGGNQTPVAALAREVGRDRLTVPITHATPTPIEKPKDRPSNRT
jgi:hypothetical protein